MTSQIFSPAALLMAATMPKISRPWPPHPTMIRVSGIRAHPASPELGGGGLTVGRDPVTAEHHPDGGADDPQVQPERQVVDVLDVERELRLPRERVAAAHLGQAGD